MAGAEPISDGLLFLHFFAGIAIVLSLIGALAFGLRYAMMKGWIRGGLPRGDTRRLQLCETLPLDTRRRLALVRCDETAYLLLLGPDHSVLVAALPATPPSLPPPPHAS